MSLSINTAHKLGNIILPTSIIGIAYLLNRRNKRLSVKNKKVLKVLLISSIALYTISNLKLISGLLKIVTHKLQKQKAVESIENQTKKFKLPKPKKIVIGSIIVVAVIGLGILGIRHFSPPRDPLDVLISELKKTPEMTDELRDKVNKWLSESDDRLESMEINWERELSDLKEIGRDMGFE